MGGDQSQQGTRPRQVEKIVLRVDMPPVELPEPASDRPRPERVSVPAPGPGPTDNPAVLSLLDKLGMAIAQKTLNVSVEEASRQFWNGVATLELDPSLVAGALDRVSLIQFYPL